MRNIIKKCKECIPLNLGVITHNVPNFTVVTHLVEGVKVSLSWLLHNHPRLEEQGKSLMK